jgi:hypothetical protein
MSHYHSLPSLCLRLSLLCCGALLTFPLAAQIPNLIPHQGRVAVNGVNFDGTGQFKFALVNAAGNMNYWSNNGSSTAGSQPTAAVLLPVTKGLYSALLGDTSLANMTAVPASVYSNADLRLRVWFNNGTLGFQQLTPDQRLAPNGYLPDGAVSSAKLAPGATPPAVKVTGATQNVAPNTNYLATGSGTTTFNLPTTAAIGDVVTIGSGGTTGIAVVNPYGWTARGESRGWLSVASSADGTKLVATGSNPYTNGGQLFTSSDSGQTWVARAPILAWKMASSADGSRLIAAGLDGQLWLSSDSGVTWNTREQNRDWRSVAMSADGSKIIAAVQFGRLYTSIDYGTTWTPREQTRSWLAVASSADGTKLIAGVNGGNLYVSADSGVTWIPREQIWGWRDVASSADGTRLIAVGASRLAMSADAGANWAARQEDMNWVAVASSADGMKLASAEAYDRIHVSTDAGATWSPREGTRQWVSVASSADGSKLLAAVQDGRLYTSGAVLNSTGAESAAFIFSTEGWRLTAPAGQWTPHGGDIYRPSGNIGIGTATPNFPLSFGTGKANTLLALYDEGLNWSYGLGIGDRQFRLHLGKDFSTAGTRFSFLDAPAGNELMTIKSNGRVGIGVASPVTALHVNGVITGDGSGLTNLSAAQLTGAVPPASLTSLPASNITGTLPVAALPPNVALLAGSNTFSGNQLIWGRAGIGSANPAALLQLGDANISNSMAMMRFVSTSPSRAAWRSWEIGVPGGTEDVSGKNYSFVIDDLLGGNGQPEVTVRYDTGNVGIGTASPGVKLDVNGAYLRVTGAGNEQAYIGGDGTGGDIEIGSRNAGVMTAGFWNSAAFSHMNVVGLNFIPTSDRNQKENFQPVNVREVLEKVAALPVTRWNYKADPDNPHIGPMAQDFHAAFATGPDDKHITTVDADGVALAAIKGLNEKLREEVKTKEKELTALREEKNAEIATLREETAALREALNRQSAALEARLDALERQESRTESVKLNRK